MGIHVLGLVEEYIDKIFDLFFEIPTHKKNVENNITKDIGLSIVKKTSRPAQGNNNGRKKMRVEPFL
jgi:hypothetical protein